MGYETKYTITASEHIPNFDDVLMDYSGGYYFEDGYADCKWYKVTENMKQMSRDYPLILFTVKGRGEKSEDIWVKYFYEGKIQAAKANIIFEPFDESKLK